VQADALLADNDRTNVDRRCELDEMIAGENLDASRMMIAGRASLPRA
jgi:hypothetical protein